MNLKIKTFNFHQTLKYRLSTNLIIDQDNQSKMDQLNSDENYYFSSSHYHHQAVMQIQNQKQAIGLLQVIPTVGIQKQLDKGRKHKRIKKEEKQATQKEKKLKRRVDESNISSMGRPQNRDIEIEHLKQNKSFNDIIYHFSRFTIFLKLIQKNNSLHTLELQNNQNGWMSQTQKIMSIQNFPAFDQEKPAFLLHPNSLHYVFQYHELHSNRQRYCSQEVKYMFFAFLKRRNLLSTNIYQYITDFWPDIVTLVNNPDGENKIQTSPSDNNLQNQVQDMSNSNSQPQDLLNTVFDKLDEENNLSRQKNKGKEKPREKTQMEELKEELLEDETIVAYQIACYLHSCSEKFHFVIIPSI